MSKTFTTLSELLKKSDNSLEEWRRIFLLSASLEKEDLADFHEIITIKFADEGSLHLALAALILDGRMETIQLFQDHFQHANAHEILKIVGATRIRNRPEINGILSDLVARDDQLEHDGAALLKSVAKTGNVEFTRLLLARGANPDDASDDNANTFEALAVLIASNSANKENLMTIFRLLLQHKYGAITEDDVVQHLRLSVAKTVLTLAYSQNSAPSSDALAKIFVDEDVLSSAEIDTRHKATLDDLLRHLAAGEEFVTESGTSLKVVRANLQEHQSYILIEHDGKGNVVSFCAIDGNDIFKPYQEFLEEESDSKQKRKKPTLHQRELQRDKVENVRSASAAEEPHKDYKFHALRLKAKAGTKLPQFLDAIHAEFTGVDVLDAETSLTRFVAANAEHDEFGRPIVEGITPAKDQSRDNCIWKAFTILIKTILREAYGKEIDLVDGKPVGEAYEVGKEFEHAVIAHYAKEVIELAHPKNAGKSFHAQACQFVETKLEPNAQRKKAKNLKVHPEFSEASSLGLAEYILVGVAANKKAAKPSVATTVIAPDSEKWWRYAIRQINDGKDANLLAAIKFKSLELLDNQQVFSEEKTLRTISRMRSKSGFIIEESHFQLVRAIDSHKGLSFLQQKEQESLFNLEQDPQNQENIAARMVILLGKGEADKTAEFQELKARFLQASNSPGKSTKMSAISRASRDTLVRT